MESDGLTDCLLIIAAVIIKAYCSAAEAAVTEISDAKVRSFENGSKSQKRLYRLLEKPARLITAFAANRIFFAVLIAYLAFHAFLEPLKSAFGNIMPFGTTFASAAVILLGTTLVLTALCDALPRAFVTRDNCESFALSCVPAVNIIAALAKPFTAFSGLLVALAAKISGKASFSSGDGITEEEILMMVDAGNETGVIEENQKEMINNVFDFDDLKVSDVMTHRTDVTAVDISAEIADVVSAAIDSGFSRIPVYKDSIDSIVGIICVKDLLCMIGSDTLNSVGVSDFIRDVIYIPETADCTNAFRQLSEHKMQLAVVVDEYGGTAGIVTMEDIVESIVGNIQDEYDDETEDIVKLSDGSFIIDGTAEPEKVLDRLGIVLPEDNDFDTVSGLLVNLLGRIPEKNETPSVEYGGCTFTVLLTEDMCITKVKAVKNPIDRTENDT